MKRTVCRNLAMVVVLATLSAFGQQDISITRFLQALAEEHAFEIQGMYHVGNDSFVPPHDTEDPERALARALSRYNYVVRYADRRVARVLILGRKGSDVGALPEDGVPAQDELPEQ